MPAQDNRRGYFHISVFFVQFSPIIQKRILKNHSFWKEERESRAFVAHHEQAKLPAKFSVVTLFRLLHHVEVFFQVCLLRVGNAIDSGKHLVLFASAPVCTCKACQLESLNRFCRHKVRSCAQIYKFALLVEADLLAFRQIFYQFYFIWFVIFFKICDGFFPCLGKAFDRQCFFDDLFHLRFDFFQIFRDKWRLAIQIIIESIVNGWADGQFCLRIETLDRLGHNMGCGMPECAPSVFRVECQQFQLAVLGNVRPQVNDIPVYLCAGRCPCQPFADIFCNIQYGHASFILFYRAIFQCNLHNLYPLFSFLIYSIYFCGLPDLLQTCCGTPGTSALAQAAFPPG